MPPGSVLQRYDTATSHLLNGNIDFFGNALQMTKKVCVKDSGRSCNAGPSSECDLSLTGGGEKQSIGSNNIDLIGLEYLKQRPIRVKFSVINNPILFRGIHHFIKE